MGFKTICSQCRKHKKTIGKHDLCKKCLDNNFQKHIQSMREKSGAPYEKWLDHTSKALQRAKKKLKRDKKKLDLNMRKNMNSEIARVNMAHKGSQKPVTSIKQARVKNNRPDKL